MAISEDEVRCALTLALTEGVGPTIYARLIERFVTPARALEADRSCLTDVEGIGDATAERIVGSRRKASDRAARALDRADRLGLACVTVGDTCYPPLLRLISDPPPVLFAGGDLRATPEPSIGIVGSRRATVYGIEQAERFAQTLSQRHSMTIVSGGARGVDTAAHRATRRAGGRTVVVLGAGHAVPYPPENADLYTSIANEGGLVLSEFPPDTPPARENFPGRNRLISGLSIGVLVIEAPKRSGALITARLAVEDHGREALAIPGRVDSEASAGVNELIRAGFAAMVTTPAEAAQQLREPAGPLLAAACEQLPMQPTKPRPDAPKAGLEAATPASCEHAPRIHPTADAADTPYTHPIPLTPPGASTPAYPPAGGATPTSTAVVSSTPRQNRILEALRGGALSIDDLGRYTGLDIASIRAEVTILEIKGTVSRVGTVFSRIADH